MLFLWGALGIFAIVCLIALLHHDPQLARQIIASICLAVQNPFLLLQNLLASAVSALRKAATSIFASVGSFHKAVGAFIHLVVFIILSSCGLFLTLLTIAGLFGMELSWAPPLSLEILSAFAFSVALSFLVAVLLELIGVSHFGLWEAFPDRIKPLLIIVLLASLALGVCLIFWMGLARWHSMHLEEREIHRMMSVEASDEITEKVLEEEIRSLSSTSPEEARNSKRVMIGLPLFIDTVAALAFCGAILGLQILGACVLWLLSVSIQILNIPFTIVVQFIDHIGNALIAIVDFFSNLGRRFGWQEEFNQSPQATRQQQSHHQASAQNQQKTSEQQNPSPDEEASNQQQLQTAASLPLANPARNGSAQAALPSENNGDFFVPELTPIGTTALNPLEVDGDLDDENLTGGDWQ
ncbi:hypothetical protein [Fervidibacter sacchari]